MNFSSYIEDKYSEELQLPKKDIEKTDIVPAPIEQQDIVVHNENNPIIDLSEEINKRDFYDFDIDKNFIGNFIGPGATYQWIDENKKPWIIKTWAFRDRNGLPWVIPQWDILNIPQGDFKGFAAEEPGKYLYQITYLEKDNEGKHNIAIFKKQL